MQALRDLFELYCRDPDRLDADAADAVRIDTLNIEREMSHQAESYLHWARLSSFAESELAAVESHTKGFVYAECCVQARRDIEKSGEKPTEKMIESLATRSQAYQQQLTTLRNAERVASVFKRIESAMWQRRDMLQSVNSRQCKELSGIPHDLEALKDRARRVFNERQ